MVDIDVNTLFRGRVSEVSKLHRLLSRPKAEVMESRDRDLDPETVASYGVLYALSVHVGYDVQLLKAIVGKNPWKWFCRLSIAGAARHVHEGFFYKREPSHSWNVNMHAVHIPSKEMEEYEYEMNESSHLPDSPWGSPVFELGHGLQAHLLGTRSDLIMEGIRQGSCIGGYTEQLGEGLLFMVSIRRKKKVVGTYTTALFDGELQYPVFLGQGNRSLDDLDWAIVPLVNTHLMAMIKAEQPEPYAEYQDLERYGKRLGK